ncbi:alpha/beta fold hydrolase [uncultured Modestobacter sp.]|uniref:alpha/beta fold hydrolase n=1 Tax=uncultured Modestobacter sp. TaxID=380048 RepID=UPI00262338C3|nr:alpha/beta fold hydrolase [uncultured Modestobacter sp.]
MAGYAIPGALVREHEVPVPLHWGDPDAGTITVFARELVAPDRRDDDLPLLLFLQGGPGGKAPRPTTGGWLDRALRDFRVVLLDQRGTGRSSRVTGRRISAFPDPADAARHLLAFRADSIVRDAEELRRTVYGGRRWTTLGQSYGGFLTLSYLSTAPEALDRCLVTGGLAGLTAGPREVYRRTWPRVAAKNRQFSARYPADAGRLAAVADRLDAAPVHLPDGDRLTVRRLQTLGHALGTLSGAEELHWLLDEAFDTDSELSDGFLDAVAQRTSYWDNPLYMTLQEVIYASGPGATGWAAEAERGPEFDADRRPLLFTGEMVFPWMFDEVASLRPFGPAAHALAEVPEFPPLYDPARLADNDVPVDAAVYADDMYVDAGLSLETAARVGNVRTWVTNEFEHDGLRTGDVLDRLLAWRADHP